MDNTPEFLQGLTAVLLFSAFVKIALTLSIFRFGLGLDGALFGTVTLVLALGLTLSIMLPEVEKAGGIESYLFRQGPSAKTSIERLHRPYMESRTDPVIAEKFAKIVEKQSSLRLANKPTNAAPKLKPDLLVPTIQTEPSQVAVAELEQLVRDQAGEVAQVQDVRIQDQGIPSAFAISETKFPVLVAAFLVSELRLALYLGLLFIIPFVVIDLLIAVMWGSLGIQGVPYQVAALPLKLLLFLAVDGWNLLAERLLGIG